MKKRFGIDIDGTVTCPTSLIPFINKAFNMDISYEDINQYDLTPFVNVSKDEFAQWFTENEPTIYRDSPLANGAKSVLNKWATSHELFYISARGAHLLAVTEDWFTRNGVLFNHIELIGSHDKIETAKKYNVDIFFEDKHDNAVAIFEECHIPVILFDTPYNQEPIPKGVIRVHNWHEALDWVDHWLKQQTYQTVQS
ncbi:5' nucleotidase, NT5C type [Bacillus rubiinfantis]|uniref:5' nucleotidase, NT5C type n=1 Tax=Bacillus rubiinfantis TaxID=1499680 RepID=UPI0005A92E9C|nr:nucleotidase [Bacillus rubiinfantis]